jgi:CMP-N,N'-diacetyllegionaminic acid synthase
MRVLYLITARGGSKAIPRKNLCEINGTSLLGFKAISARKSKYCSRLILSTDDEEIEKNALKYDVEVPFRRPAELATDTAPTADVIAHAMDWIEREAVDCFDAIMLLEPSSPFARNCDYDCAVEMMMERDANAIVAIRPTEVNSTYVGPLDKEGRISSIIDKMKRVKTGRRQDMQVEYTASGALYLMKWEYFKKHRDIYHDRDRTYGYIIEDLYGIEIDRPIDLLWARFIAERGIIEMSHWQ